MDSDDITKNTVQYLGNKGSISKRLSRKWWSINPVPRIVEMIDKNKKEHL